MFRFRRYRVFVICAGILLFLLYRASQSPDFTDAVIGKTSSHKIDVNAKKQKQPDSQAGSQAGLVPEWRKGDGKTGAESSPENKVKGESEKEKEGPAAKEPASKTSREAVDKTLPEPTKKAAASQEGADDDSPKPPKTTPKPASSGPDPIFKSDGSDDDDDQVRLEPGGGSKEQDLWATTTVHWQKPWDHFSIPEEELIMLPTGTPKPIPRIQHDFKEPESEAAKEKREARLAFVKGELQRAWNGYRKYGWLHDEITPVSKKNRDPFCGWAATLVDALDTLWIAGMKEEFNEAYAALDKIDFTTTPHRTEIPVFETTIRYLGGFLAAYDMTGGHKGRYPKLLAKAEELAEILIGVFDTPNRMPVLYYAWQPAFTLQAQRASTSSGVAEMGTLSMEFTRLAQLTGKNKYYDAIARVTDAFEDLQNRPQDTAINGIFPENLDASGCNRSQTVPQSVQYGSQGVQESYADPSLEEDPVGYQPEMPDDGTNHSSKNEDPDLEFSVKPGGRPGEPGTGEFKKIDKSKSADEDSDLKKRAPGRTRKKVQKEKPREAIPKVFGTAPFMADGSSAEWNCAPMGLVPGGYGREQYSMGGAQDSAYEYFPKQYLLLGGLVPKYRSIHEKVAKAVKKHLLFRAYSPDNRDILFSAKVSSRAGTITDVSREYEVPHLTCFLGGMFAMGGRIFDIPEDVEIGKQLTEGCVWAYESMPAGVMPEYSRAAPCLPPKSKRAESMIATPEECKWDEKTWHKSLDPMEDMREAQMLEYEEKLVEWKKKKAEVEEKNKLKKQQKSEGEKEKLAKATAGGSADLEEPALPPPRSRKQVQKHGSPTSTQGGKRKRPAENETIFKGDLSLDDPDPEEMPVASTKKHNKRESIPDSPTDIAAAEISKLEKKIAALEEELRISKTGGRDSSGDEYDDNGQPISQSASYRMYSGQSSAQYPIAEEEEEEYLPPEPLKPLTHKEYVASRLKNEKIPPGFTDVGDPRYILRPEALESVWYMYRITGDTAWQDKGWRMFTSIINATQTPDGHSAISDVRMDADATAKSTVDDDPAYDPGNSFGGTHGAVPAQSKSKSKKKKEQRSRPGGVQLDNMESFWIAETLKYAYLLFATPDVVSLDEWVLNTEAHPFKRPT